MFHIHWILLILHLCIWYSVYLVRHYYEDGVELDAIINMTSMLCIMADYHYDSNTKEVLSSD